MVSSLAPVVCVGFRERAPQGVWHLRRKPSPSLPLSLIHNKWRLLIFTFFFYPRPCKTVPYWDTENENGIELKSRVFVSAIFGSATDVGTATDPISGRSQGPWCVTKGVAAYPGWQDENGNCLIRYFESWLQQPEKVFCIFILIFNNSKRLY